MTQNRTLSKWKILGAALVVLMGGTSPRAEPPPQTADAIFFNGNIYTVNEAQPHAQAVATKGDRIVFAGSNAEAKKWQGSATRVIDLRRGIQVETHAIGDRANRVILDLYERAFHAVPPEQRKIREPRWRVEHAQILSPADIPRFAKLGVIPSMQASHAISDLFFAPSRLGLPRLAGAYA